MASVSQPQIVYVGNIPYNATEKEIVEVLQEAGPVVSFHIKTEKDGKSKGYGFCEYRDEETALSARRNLNGYPIRGRNLRVDEHKGGGGDKKQPQVEASPMPVQIPNPSAPRTTPFSNPSLPNSMQVPITQFPAEVEHDLLQQVLSLPPEILSSLSPWEQQQVIQLQQRCMGRVRPESYVDDD